MTLPDFFLKKRNFFCVRTGDFSFFCIWLVCWLVCLFVGLLVELFVGWFSLEVFDLKSAFMTEKKSICPAKLFWMQHCWVSDQLIF